MKITEKAMRFTFFFMIFMLFAVWAYDFAKNGSLLSVYGIMTIAFWVFFGISYAVIKLRS